MESNKEYYTPKTLMHLASKAINKNRSGHDNKEQKTPPFETDPITLVRRQKQIDYGKNTIEYQEYLAAVPKENRQKYHPKTPVLHKKVSRRAWDGEIRMWRLLLHAYGPEKDTKGPTSQGPWSKKKASSQKGPGPKILCWDE